MELADFKTCLEHLSYPAEAYEIKQIFDDLMTDPSIISGGSLTERERERERDNINSHSPSGKREERGITHVHTRKDGRGEMDMPNSFHLSASH